MRLADKFLLKDDPTEVLQNKLDDLLKKVQQMNSIKPSSSLEKTISLLIDCEEKVKALELQNAKDDENEKV